MAPRITARELGDERGIASWRVVRCKRGSERILATAYPLAGTPCDGRVTAPLITDAELIAASARGDHAAFETLYRRHRDWVVRVANRFAGNHEDALDVLQDTFAYLLQKLDGLVLEHRLTTFLYPVIRNLAVDRRRRARRDAELVPDHEPTVLWGFPSDVREWFAGLGSVQQEILGLRFADQLELKEIADDPRRAPGHGEVAPAHTALAALREKGLP